MYFFSMIDIIDISPVKSLESIKTSRDSEGSDHLIADHLLLNRFLLQYQMWLYAVEVWVLHPINREIIWRSAHDLKSLLKEKSPVPVTYPLLHIHFCYSELTMVLVLSV